VHVTRFGRDSVIRALEIDRGYVSRRRLESDIRVLNETERGYVLRFTGGMEGRRLSEGVIPRELDRRGMYTPNELVCTLIITEFTLKYRQKRISGESYFCAENWLCTFFFVKFFLQFSAPLAEGASRI